MTPNGDPPANPSFAEHADAHGWPFAWVHHDKPDTGPDLVAGEAEGDWWEPTIRREETIGECVTAHTEHVTGETMSDESKWEAAIGAANLAWDALTS